MRVAILHDYLNQFGGAERVLMALLELFPEADLYTLLYDKKKTLGLFEKNLKKTSFLDFGLVRKKHRFFIPFMPLAARFFKNNEKYDLVISSSAGYGKGINIKAERHICYCHSPLRYAWEISYLKNLPISPWLISHQFITRPIASMLRFWDKRAAEKVEFFVANSDFIAQKIKNYYNRDSAVIHPPIDTEVFYREPKISESDYFLMVGRLLYYKRFDLGIKTFNLSGRRLKIIGSGPEAKKLKFLAKSPSIEFVPWINDTDLRKFYNGARALIFPQVEDFGLVAAEAQACGLPVLAFNQGGALEIIEEGKTGLFFNEQTPEAILKTINNFEALSFDRTYISERAKRFSKEEFKDKMRNIINA